ncbi:MAG: right-handed parallel beta-helix repeat-containing protein [Candidatus Pacebacteria bacterium]|nr:right-handed parallel beta-helix repeat-containing protein [Candidatus Paceibacterota bacterium]
MSHTHAMGTECKKLLGGLMALFVLGTAGTGAREVFVDNVKGNDAWDGSEGKPYKTIQHALLKLRTSDTLHLTPNKVPYRGPVSLDRRNNAELGGTAEQPMVVDGHGAEITGFRRFEADEWKDEGNGVFSMPFGSNGWMKRHWEGFDLVYFDGKPGTSVRSKPDLVPFGYLWFSGRMHPKSEADVPLNTLYIMLPEGQTPADVVVESGSGGTMFSINANYVTVKNLKVSWSRNDGFGSAFSKGLVYENVETCFNMDQGMSHHSSIVHVRHSHFHDNAGCGIVDIRMRADAPAQSVYEHCLIENDSYRGGIEFHDGVYTMKNCIIRNNKGPAAMVTHHMDYLPAGGEAVFENCLFMDGGGISVTGRTRNPKNRRSGAEFINCTFYKNGGIGIGVDLSQSKPSKIVNCAFIDPKGVVAVKQWKGPTKNLTADYNYYGGGSVVFGDKRYAFPEEWEDHKKATGLDTHSLLGTETFEDVPYCIQQLQSKGKDGMHIGACIEWRPEDITKEVRSGEKTSR